MQRATRVALFALIALMVTQVVAGEAVTKPAPVCPGVDLENAATIESNEFFEVVAPNKLEFRDGIFYETVRDKNGVSYIRYGFDEEDARAATSSGADAAGAVVRALYCRCHQPTLCEGECSASTTGGQATCTGGCYMSGGQPCVSCAFYSTATPVGHTGG